jgi:phosphoribosylanthranilate isomerase
LFDAGDAVVLDAKVSGVLGGSGVAFDWTAVATQIDVMRTRAPLVLAGGLTPSNISVALAAMRPDVVDVSSGVESAPGIKDHHAMRAFAAAVAQWNQETT